MHTQETSNGSHAAKAYQALLYCPLLCVAKGMCCKVVCTHLHHMEAFLTCALLLTVHECCKYDVRPLQRWQGSCKLSALHDRFRTCRASLHFSAPMPLLIVHNRSDYLTRSTWQQQVPFIIAMNSDSTKLQYSEPSCRLYRLRYVEV